MAAEVATLGEEVEVAELSGPLTISRPLVAQPSFSNAARLLGSSPSGHSFSNVICHNCGGKGHIRPDCPSPRSVPSTRPYPNPIANLATSPAQPSGSQQWMIDSGTNHHLTADLDKIANHTEYSGTDEVTFGNGKTLPISHSIPRFFYHKCR
ncbi:Retrovirus-related Pol polyprotein from transposon RE1 [Linum perenne]